MADWNPKIREDCERVFGLVGVPYFGHHRTMRPPGTHFMMQDGEAASFALHIASADRVLGSNRPLAWAWSANVRHVVVLDPITKAASIRRWDDPSKEKHRVIASDRDAQRLIRDLEGSRHPPAGRDVIQRTLKAFSELRDAIEQRGGTETDVVVAFNAALVLAERWRDSPDQLPPLTLAEAVERLHADRCPGFFLPPSQWRVRDYPLGDFASILLKDWQPDVPYPLDTDLLIRHASGRLYQEAHRRLAKPASAVFQGTFFNEPLADRPGGRRQPPPSFVHHTPPWLARAMAEVALKLRAPTATDPLDVLDPACGSGVFLIETVRELERFHTGHVRVRGMDLSPVAGLMTEFCVGEASRDLTNVTVAQLIRPGIDSLLETDWGQPDIILMNPPFKAWEDLSTSERATVEHALGAYMAGRPDLYFAFLVRAALALKPGGVLASVVSSPFFSAESASKIHKLLQTGEFRVRLVGLFRGFQTFDQANVEAALLVVSRTAEDAPVRLVIAQNGQAEKAVRLLRTASPTQAVRIAGVEIRDLPPGPISRDGRLLLHQRDAQFADALAAQTTTRVRDFFTVRLGIRGLGGVGMQKVLMLSADQFHRFAPTPNEQRFFRPVADRIERGRIVPSDFVFYPYAEDRRLLLATRGELEAALPAFYREVLLPAKPYLQSRGSINRKKGRDPTRNWWEPSEPVTTWLAARYPRIVSQQFGKSGNFAFDEEGRYAVAGGHGWCWNGGPPKKDVMLEYLALLNSRVFERLLGLYCPQLRGLQYNLAKRYVHHIPLPGLTTGTGELAAIGRLMHAGKPYDADQLDSAVLAAYGVNREGRAANDKTPAPSSRTSGTAADRPSQDSKRRFQQLASRWKKETAHQSSMAVKAEHEAYQEILAMGQDAVPYILEDLSRSQGSWFHALRTLTGANPVPEKSRGILQEMVDAWLDWGRKHGHEV